MAKGQGGSSELWRCMSGFSIFKAGIPEVFPEGREVFGDDPILRTHRQYFEPAADRVARVSGRVQVEQATAAPGEYRTAVTPGVPSTTTAREL